MRAFLCRRTGGGPPWRVAQGGAGARQVREGHRRLRGGGDAAPPGPGGTLFVAARASATGTWRGVPALQPSRRLRRLARLRHDPLCGADHLPVPARADRLLCRRRRRGRQQVGRADCRRHPGAGGLSSTRSCPPLRWWSSAPSRAPCTGSPHGDDSTANAWSQARWAVDHPRCLRRRGIGAAWRPTAGRAPILRRQRPESERPGVRRLDGGAPPHHERMRPRTP